MQLEIRRSRASAGSKLYVKQHAFDVGQLKRRHLLSDDVARRILSISRTMDQANAIAELMK
jgi:hypothetical protein